MMFKEDGAIQSELKRDPDQQLDLIFNSLANHNPDSLSRKLVIDMN